MDFNWVSMGFQWDFNEIWGFQWGFNGVSMDFNGVLMRFQWISMGFQWGFNKRLLF